MSGVDLPEAATGGSAVISAIGVVDLVKFHRVLEMVSLRPPWKEGI